MAQIASVSQVALADTGSPTAVSCGIKSRFRFGPWLVDPSTNSIADGDEKRQMEPRTMDVLLALCHARGDVVSSEELLVQCWGSSIYSDSPVHKNVAQLRRLLGDNVNTPAFIETIRKRGYRTVAELVFDLDAPSQTPTWDAGSPFRGLLPFDEAHADVFYGRDEVIRKLADAARAQIDSGLALLLLLGPSGAGKTSVVQAGLLPALSLQRTTGGTALLATTTFDIADQGEQTLFTALAGALLDLQWVAQPEPPEQSQQGAFAGESAVSLGLRLEHECGAVIASMRTVLAAQPQAHPDMRFGIFIDRFEALFNANRITEKERQAFIDSLELLARGSACLLVLACRNDFYPSVAKYALLTEGKCHGGHFDLAPPGFSDVAQIIRRPAAAAKLTFGVEPVSGARLDDVLCESAAATPDALPLLQYCLQELYRLRTPEGELSFEAFRQLGEVEEAIGRRAEQVMVTLSDAQRHTLPHIMSLVTVLSADEENVTSQRAPWSALGSDAARQTVSALVESRLFITDLAGGAPVFGIAHDAILRRWPRMTDWIAAHRDALRTRGRLLLHAGRWASEGRPADLLLPPGKLLDEAKALRRAGIWSLGHDENELIATSDRRARQREWLRLFVLVLILALAVLTAGLGISAVGAKRSAELRRAEAEGLVDFMLGDFADKLRPIGRLDLLESVSGKAMEYLRGGQDEEVSPAALTLRAKGLQVIGEVSRSRGDANQAIDALDKANAILMHQHALNPRDLQVLKNLGANAYWTGLMHKDHNNLQAAGEAYRRYQEFADQLHRLDPDNLEWWVEQSYARNNLGALALARGLPGLAAPEFAASIALKERALEHMPESKTIAAELADSYSWLGLARQSLGELKAASQLYEKEIAATQRLRERFPSESLWTYRHAHALQHRALMGLAMGMDDSALRDYQEAKQLLTLIAGQDRKNSAWQVELANVEQSILKMTALRTPASDMLPRLIQVHHALQELLRLDPKNSQWARSEALARCRIAAALLATGQTQAARQEIEAALAPLSSLYASTPANMETRLALITSLLQSEKIYRAERDNNKLILTCNTIYAMIEKDIATTMDYKILDPWVRVNFCLSNRRAAEAALNRLQQIGYRDTSYMQFVSTQ